MQCNQVKKGLFIVSRNSQLRSCSRGPLACKASLSDIRLFRQHDGGPCISHVTHHLVGTLGLEEFSSPLRRRGGAEGGGVGMCSIQPRATLELGFPHRVLAKFPQARFWAAARIEGVVLSNISISEGKTGKVVISCSLSLP